MMKCILLFMRDENSNQNLKYSLNRTTFYYMKKLFFFLVIITSSILFAQSNSSIIVEIHKFKSENTAETIQYNQPTKTTQYPITAYATNISYVYKRDIFQLLQCEMRAGFLIGDLDLIGIDFGLYIRKDLIWRFFGVIGLTSHYNFGFNESHNTWSSKSENGFYLFSGGSLGFKISKKISILGGYYLTSNETLRSSWKLDVNTGQSTVSNEKLDWIIKAGMEINLN